MDETGRTGADYSDKNWCNKKKSERIVEAKSARDEGRKRLRAKVALTPSTGASLTLREWLRVESAPDLSALSAELRQQGDAISTGDLTRAEAMLTAQAHVLDQIFGNLAARAANAEYMPQLETYLKLALRAQTQATRTWEAVVAI